jgi:hypothetical protein
VLRGLRLLCAQALCAKGFEPLQATLHPQATPVQSKPGDTSRDRKRSRQSSRNSKRSSHSRDRGKITKPGSLEMADNASPAASGVLTSRTTRKLPQNTHSNAPQAAQDTKNGKPAPEAAPLASERYSMASPGCSLGIAHHWVEGNHSTVRDMCVVCGLSVRTASWLSLRCVF